MPIQGGAGLLQQLDGPAEIASRYRDGGFSTFVPREYVTLSADGGGALAIRITEPGRGKVYWADYDRAIELYDDGVIEAGEATEQIVSELAPDWDAFLASR